MEREEIQAMIDRVTAYREQLFADYAKIRGPTPIVDRARNHYQVIDDSLEALERELDNLLEWR